LIMRVSNAIPIVLAVLILLCIPIMADVIFRYNGIINVKPIRSPITVISGSCPCGCSSWNPTYAGFTSTITAYTMSTTSGYVLTTPLVTLNASNAGTITMTLSTNTIVVSDYINGTQIYPGQGSISLSAGQNLLIQKLTLASPVTNTITLNGQYNYQPTTGTTFYYSFTETINPPTADIMNLLNGQQSWYVPHVYQGDSNGRVNTNYPTYYGSNTASNYWGLRSGIIQPILDMTPNSRWYAGVMFWSENYSGGSITINLLGTFSVGSNEPSDGFQIYLFLKPTQWSVTPQYNWSIPYLSSSPGGIGTYLSVQGDVIMPQSQTPYLIIQWDPEWQQPGKTTPSGGQFDVWIISNPTNNKNDLNVYVVGGIGNGYFFPNPGDYICVSVTYDPSTNTIIAYAVDLNTGATASLTYKLGNNYAPPTPGIYVFGVAGSTGASHANWGIVYVNYQSQ